MSEVKRIQRYSRDFQGTMSKDSNGPWVLVGDAAAREGLLIEKIDAQRLRADTAELKAIKESMAYRGSLFGKVQAERDAAEQRNSELVELLRMMKDNGGYLDEQEWERIDAALNPNREAESHEN